MAKALSRISLGMEAFVHWQILEHGDEETAESVAGLLV
jgi:hypothetical protein